MHPSTFLIASLLLAFGIALAPAVAVPHVVQLCVLLALLVVIFVAHTMGRTRLFALSFALFIVVVGIARAQQGNISLLPHQLTALASHLSQLAVERLLTLGMPHDVTALVQAMLLGRRDALTSQIRDLYSIAGASHVLALSGLHLSVLFGAFHYCLMRVASRAALRIAMGCFGLFTLWSYALLSGLPVSLVRAAVMMSIFLISQMRQGGVSGWHTLGVAAMLILFVAPTSLWNIGFQLSSASMLGLIAFCVPLLRLFRLRCLVLRWLWSGFAVSLSAQALSLPLVLHYFRSYSPYSPLFSPFYVLLAALILYAALLAILWGRTAIIVTALVSIQHGLMRCVSQLPYSVVLTSRHTWGQVILQWIAVVCFASAFFPKAQHREMWEFRGAYAVFILRRWSTIVAAVSALILAHALG